MTVLPSLSADQQVKSLSSILSRYQGFDGEDGGRKNCFGRGGSPLYIRVPVGTLVKEGSEVVADLSHPGEEYVAAVGGAGGKGNRFFLANNSRAPVTCTPGQPGQERVLFLELKTVAHAGLAPVSGSSRHRGDRLLHLSSRSGTPMRGNPLCSGPFPMRNPLWLPTRSPP